MLFAYKIIYFQVDRVDLTHLKVYAIDVDEADEVCCSVLLMYSFFTNYKQSFQKHMQLDDALSATRLEDGRIRIWIHVADPASLVQPGSIIDKYIRTTC